MAQWHYYNENKEKIAVTGKELKQLALSGTITPETFVETPDGKTGLAKNVTGLTFAIPVPTPVSVPIPIVEKNTESMDNTDSIENSNNNSSFWTRKRKLPGWLQCVIGLCWGGWGLYMLWNLILYHYMVLYIIILLIISCVIVMITSRQTAKRIASQTVKANAYITALSELQKNPSCLSLRKKAWDLGIEAGRSEQQVTNEILMNSIGLGEGVAKTNVAEEIQKLSVLHTTGVITQEEFDCGKALFLGSPPDKVKKTMEAIANLHQLMKLGALSEGEFNMKKWDLLAGKLVK